MSCMAVADACLRMYCMPFKLSVASGPGPDKERDLNLYCHAAMTAAGSTDRVRLSATGSSATERLTQGPAADSDSEDHWHVDALLCSSRARLSHSVTQVT